MPDSGRALCVVASVIASAPAPCYNAGMSKPNPQLSEAIKRLKVLADPDRLHIAACLLNGPYTAGELAQELRKDMIDVLDHLQIMVDAGLVRYEGVVPFATYSFLPEVSLAALSSESDATIDFGCCKLTMTQINDMKRGSGL